MRIALRTPSARAIATSSGWATVRKVVISVPSLPTQSYGLESFVLLEERAPLDHAAVSEGPDIGPLVLEGKARLDALASRDKHHDDEVTLSGAGSQPAAADAPQAASL